jgi:molecular chaperone HtpG
MSLIINTFYSNKEIFLRELISNSSDALDKIRYQSLTDSSVLDSEKELKIEIICDKTNNTISIKDTGIGMTKNDLINNLGTIAKSGTKSFMEAISTGTDMSMIGQFGVGFYAAYLVANHVVVHSKHNDDEQHVWESSAGGSFTVKLDTDSERLTRGTKIVLHLKDDMKEYLENNSIIKLVKKHSEFITFPIYLWSEKTREEEVEEENETSSVLEEVKDEDGGPTVEDVKDGGPTVEDVKDGGPTVEDVKDDGPTVEDVKDDGPKVEDVSEPEPKEKEKKKVQIKYNEFDLLNNQKPLWMCKKEDITSEQYESFYKLVKLDTSYHEYCHVEHFSVEGQLEFKAILYVPTNAPFEMFSSENRKGIKLYVRRVFITNDYEMLPKYLDFVCGVVDSDDLPLNISREILQQNKVMGIIKKNLVKRCMSIFADIAEDKDKYKTFYKQFSKNIKLGIYEDANNRDKLIKFLRYETSKSGETQISLDDYISNMPDHQESIYYITGENKKVVENSPFLEKLRSKNFEVLFMVDPMDEYVMQHVKEYEKKKFVNITREGLTLEESEDEKARFEEEKKSLEELLAMIKIILGDKITKVSVSNRLSDSPCVLVTGEYGWTANMERIMKAQTLGSHMTPVFSTPKSMEINPYHRIIKNLRNKLSTNNSDKSIKDLVWLLYETSLLTSGFILEEPNKFGSRIHRLIELGLDIGVEEEENRGNTDEVNRDTNIQNTKVENVVEEQDSQMEQVD